MPPGQPEVVLPQTAIDYTLYGDSVFVLKPDGNDANGKPILEVHRVAVKTGAKWADKVAVLGGLGRAGDQVIAAGQIKCRTARSSP